MPSGKSLSRVTYIALVARNCEARSRGGATVELSNMALYSPSLVRESCEIFRGRRGVLEVAADTSICSQKRRMGKLSRGANKSLSDCVVGLLSSAEKLSDRDVPAADIDEYAFGPNYQNWSRRAIVGRGKNQKGFVVVRVAAPTRTNERSSLKPPDVHHRDVQERAAISARYRPVVWLM